LIWLLSARRPNAFERRLEALRAAGNPTTLRELASAMSRSPEASRRRFLGAVANLSWAADAAPRRYGLVELPDIPASSWTATNVLLARSVQPLTHEAVDELGQALAAPVSLGVELDSGGQPVIPRIFDFIMAARALAFERQAATVRGNGAAVVLLTTAGLRTGAALASGSLVEVIGQFAAHRIMLKDLDDVLGRNCLTVEQLQELRLELESPDLAANWRAALSAERLFILSHWPRSYSELEKFVAQNGNAGDLLQAGPYHLFGLNAADRIRYFDYMQRLIDVAALTGTNAVAAQAKLPATPPTGLVLGRGFSMLNLVVPRIFSAGQEVTTQQTRLRAASTATALLEFRLKHDGRLPATLNELDALNPPPRWLDPVSEQPLRYQPLPDGFVLRGVGPDGVDNSGTGDDVVFTVKWWQPAAEVLRAWSEAEE